LNRDYNVISQEDVKEIDNVIEFANSLIVKDSEYADSLETNASRRTSYEYINARMNLDPNLNATEIEALLKGYTDQNAYYEKLYEDYGIDYYESRNATDLQILTVTNPILSREDQKLFYDCYYESLNYHNKIISTKAFKGQKMYRGFIRLFLIFSTIQRYLTRKMENYFNIDLYTPKMLKNAFISVGLDYFDDMPVNYQRRLLKMVNTLLSHKGTNRAIMEAVELFGFTNIEIYRYVLAKGYNKNKTNGKLDYNDPFLQFFRTPAGNEVNFSSDLAMSYDAVTEEDPYWQTTEEEVKSLSFNYFNTKYMSVDTTIDAMKETIGLSYFMSLLNKFQRFHKEKKGKDFGFVNSTISVEKVDIYDAIVALQSIVLRSHGYKDKISMNPDTINYVYGYGDIDNKIDVSGILKDIENEMVLRPRTVANFEELTEFIENFKMTSFDGEKYSIERFINVFDSNEKVRRDLERIAVESNNYRIYRNLLKLWDIKMRSKITVDNYEGNETFLEYVRKKNYDLYNYIVPPGNIMGNQGKLNDFYKERIFELTESVSNYMTTTEVKQFFLNNNFIGLGKYIEKYIYTLVSIFKAYTVDLLSANLVLSFSDKFSNSVRLFDETVETSEMYEAERVDLLDVGNFLTTRLGGKKDKDFMTIVEPGEYVKITYTDKDGKVTVTDNSHEFKTNAGGEGGLVNTGKSYIGKENPFFK
jgi:hypothetical protein